MCGTQQGRGKTNNSLLYIPQKPLRFVDSDQKHGLKLYVQRVIHHGLTLADAAKLSAFCEGLLDF